MDHSGNPYSPPADPAVGEYPILAQAQLAPGECVIEYEMTLADALAFNTYHQLHSRFGLRTFYRGWFSLALLTAMGLIAVGSILNDLLTKRTFIVAACIAWAFVVGTFPYFYRRRIQTAVRTMYTSGKNVGVFGLRRLTLAPAAITNVHPFSLTVTSWQAIEEIVRHGDYAFIYLSSVSAYVVPMRAFETPQEYERFVATALQYHQAALQGAPSESPGGSPTEPLGGKSAPA